MTSDSEWCACGNRANMRCPSCHSGLCYACKRSMPFQLTSLLGEGLGPVGQGFCSSCIRTAVNDGAVRIGRHLRAQGDSAEIAALRVLVEKAWRIGWFERANQFGPAVIQAHSPGVAHSWPAASNSEAEVAVRLYRLLSPDFRQAPRPVTWIDIETFTRWGKPRTREFELGRTSGWVVTANHGLEEKHHTLLFTTTGGVRSTFVTDRGKHGLVVVNSTNEYSAGYFPNMPAAFADVEDGRVTILGEPELVACDLASRTVGRKVSR